MFLKINSFKFCSFLMLIFIYQKCLGQHQQQQQQQTFADIRYITTSIPNGGFLEALLTGSPNGWPGETGWYKICSSTSEESKNLLSYTACAKYGYTNGALFQTTNGPCVEFSCSTGKVATSLRDCVANVFTQTKPVLSVICYYGYADGRPLSQPPPSKLWSGQQQQQQQYQSSASDRIGCDFEDENSPSCGWQLSQMKVNPGKAVYNYDATLGTDQGHLLVTDCPYYNNNNNGQYPTQTTIAPTATSPTLEACLGYSRFCFVFSSLAPVPSYDRPKFNISVLEDGSGGGREAFTTTWTSPLNAEWVVNTVSFAARTPFRLRLRFGCLSSTPSIFLDNLLLTTGDCPAYGRTFCFNSGQERDPYGPQPSCQCPNRWTTGRWCEVATCSRATNFDKKCAWCYFGLNLFVSTIMLYFITA